MGAYVPPDRWPGAAARAGGPDPSLSVVLRLALLTGATGPPVAGETDVRVVRDGASRSWAWQPALDHLTDWLDARVCAAPVRPSAPVLLDRGPTTGQALTPREREVLGHVAAGRTYAQTARRMGIRPSTVDTYLQRIRDKSGLSTMAELVRLAVTLRL